MTSGCENKESYCKQCHNESHVRKGDDDDEVILCLPMYSYSVFLSQNILFFEKKK